ncbi:MAG TPA: putative sulfate exporter family transporter [candidate division Zixibacteria bacterium]|nr:putative sulfate exporter family transporter [candidate division Zixibacteria bacterium]
MKESINSLWTNEDYWAIWFGFIIIAGSLLGWIPKIPKVGTWTSDPLNAFEVIKDGIVTGNTLLPLLGLLIGLAILTAIGVAFMKTTKVSHYLLGFTAVFILATISYWVANQAEIKYWGLSYAMWGLLVGLLISNTIGTPKWLLAGAKTEMFIKTGLVLMGAEILFAKIVSLGIPGLMVAWIVTPIVVIFMFIFAVKYLKMKNKKLAMIIAAATSVCGVSAAIATAAACRAKKEDLTLGVGMTLIFTVLMMFFMPLGIKFIGMNHILGAAWMGGTIDSTGAVVAAGSMLGPEAEQVAAVVKMIQNVLIGLLAFCVAIYWVTTVDRSPEGPRPNAMEIWYRFPKFVLGFVAASLLFSFVIIPAMHGDVAAVESRFINPITHTLRGWFFCLAFVAIGLESNFRELTAQMEGGKPMILYVVGQTFNLILTLFVAWLAFMVLFPNVV